MRMTKENKEWLRIALFLGEDSMHIFRDSRWEWLSEDDVFMNAYVRFGGDADTPFENEDALDRAIGYAQRKIDDCFDEIRRRILKDEY